MDKMQPHIHLNLIQVDDDNPACETEMYGDLETLSSLVFSGMLSNENFAEIIMLAALTYNQQTTPKEVYLN